ncbi:MAG: hypothetical protein QG665_170 [Patescibacteria group bacterium]|nr:hypothetical protein [Patescibacteria group bacterium]
MIAYFYYLVKPCVLFQVLVKDARKKGLIQEFLEFLLKYSVHNQKKWGNLKIF